MVLFSCACAGPPPAPPTALIELTPTSICRDDGHATIIQISGSRSASGISLVPSPPDPGAPPLEFTWQIDGPEHAVIDGSTLSPALSVTTLGDRPMHVTLTVMNADGGEATSVRTLGIDECAP